jgi:hypothetical protein
MQESCTYGLLTGHAGVGFGSERMAGLAWEEYMPEAKSWPYDGCAALVRPGTLQSAPKGDGSRGRAMRLGRKANLQRATSHWRASTVSRFARTGPRPSGTIRAAVQATRHAPRANWLRQERRGARH